MRRWQLKFWMAGLVALGIMGSTIKVYAENEAAESNAISHMALSEQRWVRDWKTNSKPVHEAALAKSCGTPITIRPDWNSFSHDMPALQLLEKSGLPKIEKSLANICQDDIGKAAVKKHARYLDIMSVSGTGHNHVSVGGSELDIHARWAGGIDEFWKQDELTSEIEGRLGS